MQIYFTSISHSKNNPSRLDDTLSDTTSDRVFSITDEAGVDDPTDVASTHEVEVNTDDHHTRLTTDQDHSSASYCIDDDGEDVQKSFPLEDDAKGCSGRNRANVNKLQSTCHYNEEERSTSEGTEEYHDSTSTDGDTAGNDIQDAVDSQKEPEVLVLAEIEQLEQNISNLDAQIVRLITQEDFDAAEVKQTELDALKQQLEDLKAS